MKTPRCLLLLSIFIVTQTAFAQMPASMNKKANRIGATILFQENFADTDFASRGWYDALRGTITSAEHSAGSTSCLECRFLQGERGCKGGTPGRHLFDATDRVYFSCCVKYSANYTGSNKPYHPHEFYFLTSENGIYVGPAYTHLTAYVEQNEGEPLLAIQDGENIDESKIGVDLTQTTEERAVAGCNGDSDGYGEGECYLSGALHRNGKQWRAGGIYFRHESGKYYKNDWHFIEAYFQLNSIVDGKGVADGVVRYWYDGELLIDHDDVVLRTGMHPNMKFNQFLLAPYIGDGSPVEQVMWIDDLTVATSRVTTHVRDNLVESSLIAELVLLQNYPNPFNPSTIIAYSLNTSADVSVHILDLRGRVIRRLVNGPQLPGAQQARWNGLDDSGRDVCAGVYFYQLRAGDHCEIGKMTLLR